MVLSFSNSNNFQTDLFNQQMESESHGNKRILRTPPELQNWSLIIACIIVSYPGHHPFLQRSYISAKDRSDVFYDTPTELFKKSYHTNKKKGGMMIVIIWVGLCGVQKGKQRRKERREKIRHCNGGEVRWKGSLRGGRGLGRDTGQFHYYRHVHFL